MAFAGSLEDLFETALADALTINLINQNKQFHLAQGRKDSHGSMDKIYEVQVKKNNKRVKATVKMNENGYLQQRKKQKKQS